MSSVSLDPSRFVCPLCLQLLSDPVTVPCGHSFCRSCLSPLWSSGGSGSSSSSSSSRGQSSSCPQCRATFSPTPALGTNPLLQELVRDLRAVSLQHGSAAAPEKHRGHIAQREAELNKLCHVMKDFPRLADTAVEDCRGIFSELQVFVRRSCEELEEMIRAQEKSELTRAENHRRRLEREVQTLKRSGSELQTGESLSRSGSSPVVQPRVSFGPVRKALVDLKKHLESVYVQELPTVTRAVTSVSLLQQETPARDHKPVTFVDLGSRESLLQYFCPLTFDPFSAHRDLRVSEGNRVIGRGGPTEPRPDHPERFDCWAQALSHEGVRGRGYWEAEWAGTQAAVGVAYSSVQRKGSSNASRLGHNSESWCLKCSEASWTFCHAGREQDVVVCAGHGSRRVAVFSDLDSGLLCFYAVAARGLHLLHRLENRFTQPLHAAVWLGSNSTVTLCAAREREPS